MTPLGAEAPAPPPLNPRVQDDLGICTICHQSMPLIEDGQTTHPNCDSAGGDIEVAIRAVRAVWRDAKIIGQWLTADVLFPGSGQCKDCGDPLNQPGLMQRCRDRHQVART
jgi:hypothetical protein